MKIKKSYIKLVKKEIFEDMWFPITLLYPAYFSISSYIKYLENIADDRLRLTVINELNELKL
jgi:hypothetical protein